MSVEWVLSVRGNRDHCERYRLWALCEYRDAEPLASRPIHRRYPEWCTESGRENHRFRAPCSIRRPSGLFDEDSSEQGDAAIDVFTQTNTVYDSD